MTFAYRDRSVLDDACNLLLHHVRRQSTIQKEDKRKIKQILKHFIPDLFNHPRMEMSDDENDDGKGFAAISTLSTVIPCRGLNTVPYFHLIESRYGPKESA